MTYGEAMWFCLGIPVGGAIVCILLEIAVHVYGRRHKWVPIEEDLELL